MKCPRCENIDLLISERQGVEIDYCPKCRGIWLDKGEIDIIVDRTNSMIQGQYQKNSFFYDDDDDNHQYNKNYNNYNGRDRKRSIFDFFD